MYERIDEELKKIMGDRGNDGRHHMGKVLMKTLEKYSDKINQIDVITGDSETNGSILKRSIRLAKWMKAVGLREGDVIMISAPNQLDATIVVVAALYLGVAIFPVDYSLMFDDMKHFVQLGEPKLIFCDPGDVLDNFLEVLNHTKIVSKIITFGNSEQKTLHTFRDILDSDIGNIKEKFQPNDFDPSETACFIHTTSGSTGVPKGVVLTHKTYLFHMIEFWFQEDHCFEDDIFMAGAPLHWITTTAILSTCCILGASRIISSKPFTPDIAFKMMNTYKPTLSVLGPPFIISMLEKDKYGKVDWSSLKSLFVAGGIISMEWAKVAQDKLVNGDLVNFYGMTEISGVIASFTLERPPKHMPLGRIRESLQSKVVNSEGQTLGPGQAGELLIKCPYLFKGYYKNKSATEETFTSDGWFKTGDIVLYDEDQQYFYVDREKLMMKYKSNQISPVELEKVISTHPSVASVTVDKLVIPPDDLPIAFVVRKPNVKVTEQEIKDLVASKLADYKQLRGGVVFLDSMPVTVAGKVDRKALNNIKSDVLQKIFKIFNS